MIARGVQAYQDELSFYQRFHRHPVNWRIHAVAVPLEWFGWLLALGLAPRRLLHWPFGVSVGVSLVRAWSKPAAARNSSTAVDASRLQRGLQRRAARACWRQAARLAAAASNSINRRL